MKCCNCCAISETYQAISSALSYSSSFVLFVPACPSDADRSFVVKRFYTSVRALVFDPFSLATLSE